ncbi:MAG TPA: hypothetical protein VID69_06840 [Actinomycetota bacterium]
MTARSSRRQVARIAIVVLGLVALGEAGHQVFERLGWQAGHHAFHLAYGAGAIVAFCAFAARDVRRHGLPRLTWALRPRTTPTHDPR